MSKKIAWKYRVVQPDSTIDRVHGGKLVESGTNQLNGASTSLASLESIPNNPADQMNSNMNNAAETEVN